MDAICKTEQFCGRKVTLLMGPRVAQVGCIATRSLREGASGVVAAVFDRSCYITLDGQWICVGPPGLGAGPVNVVCDPCNLIGPMSSLVDLNDFAIWHGRTLRVGSSLMISFAGAKPWFPPPPGAWNRATVRRGLSAFAAALPDMLPVEGLAPLLRPPMACEGLPPIAAAAHGNAERLGDIVRAAARHTQTHPLDARPLVSLLGLGPGLTPSGDDFLGGALVALHVVALEPLRDAIWAALEPHAAGLTNDISRAHLAAAAEGCGSEALHALLNDVITGQTEALPERIAALAAIGHTSGWDALAGAITVLRSTVPPSS